MPPRPAAESAAGRPAPSAVSERPGAAPPTAETGPRALPPGRTSPPSPGGTESETPSRGRRRRLRWLLVAAVALLAAGGGAYAWLQASQAPNLANAESEPEPMSPGEFRLSDAEMRALRIEEVQLREFRAERIAEGRIAYNEDRSTPVFSPYSGRVVRALARLGDQIRAGEPLLEIETTDLAGAANDLLSALDASNKARSTLEQAQREERRQNSLFSARAASQRDVEQARVAATNAAADLRSADAALAAARDKLRVLGRSQEQITAIEAGRQVNAVVPVAAPIGGTVVQRRVGPGQWLAPGGSDPVYTIADLSTMWLVAAVRERDAPLMRLDQPVEVTVGALPGQTFEARITSVGAGLDPATRRLTVRAEVQDPEHLLKPEMFATFRIAIGEPHRAVAVPTSAVIHRGAEASVWVALDGHRFTLRRIAAGIRTDDVLEVTEGLNAGEQVVTGGALFIDRAARFD
ncbi:MAG TPA: efflux RND transporter periplasmic adaptor subunit [Acetobacteraceae bacterium]|nr:efflux RND transporter periplasmic adaptor subunit [Acetobacteraceae bacterium]